MKILHINKFFDRRDGVDIYLHKLIQAQQNEGHEVHVLSTQSSKNSSAEDARYFIHRFDFSRSEGWKKDAKKASAFIWNREAKRMMQRVIKEIQPDCIHLHNIYHHFSSSILGVIRESGIRCVQTLHDYKLACPNYSMFTEGAVCERCKGGKYWNPIMHRCLAPGLLPNVLASVEMTMTKVTQSYERTVHRFIAPSRFMRDKMIEWGEPANAFAVVPNPIDVSSHRAKRGGGYFLFTGRLHPSKGVDVLIRAFAEMPNLSLRIAGTGPDEHRLKHLARTTGATNVSFLGFVEPERLQEIRALAEAALVPSIWYENCPFSVLEPMSEGIPVIGSRVGGIPELLTHGETGFLAEPGSVSDWKKSIELFMDCSEEERQKIIDHAFAYVQERHSWKGHLRALESLYGSS